MPLWKRLGLFGSAFYVAGAGILTGATLGGVMYCGVAVLDPDAAGSCAGFFATLAGIIATLLAVDDLRKSAP